MKSRNILLGVSLLTAVLLHAQYTDQYLHLNVGGGLHGLSYNIPNGTQKLAPGFTLNAAYSYFFSPNWGLQTGIGLQSFKSISTLNYMTGMSDIDSEGDAYQFRTYYKGWQESQQALFMDIPLAIQYRYPMSEKLGLLVSAGANLSMPVSGNFKSNGGEIQTAGYYDQWDVEFTDMPEEGFKTITDSYSGKLSIKPLCIGMIDLGVLYKLSEKLDLYVGAYGNYGLNSIITPDTKFIYQKDGVYNGMFASNQVNTVKPISVGLKVGVYWQICKKRPVVKVDEGLQSLQPVKTQKDEKPKDTIAVVEQKPVVVEVNKNTIAITEQKPVIDEIPKDTVATTSTIVKEVINQTPDSFVVVSKMVEPTSINFGLNSSQPSALENDMIKMICKYLKENPDSRMYIVGHTCNLGSRKTNLKIGMNRAVAVKQKFVEIGVPATQLITVSKAFDVPLVPNTTEENRIKNRRVEFRLTKK